MHWISAAAAWTVAFLVGSLVEYWGHRLMHAGILLPRGHLEHHASGEGKGVLPEFLHYLLYTWVFLPWGFLVSAPAGWGFLAGILSYCFFSAYGHQLQHDSPAACFWMRRMPVHYVHHLHNQDNVNLGLALDWWDRVFGTYRPVEFDRNAMIARSRGGLLDVRWF